MGREAMYLVRGPDGRMATVLAHSIRGALRLYMAQTRLSKGDSVSVKLRGAPDDWTHYSIH